MTTLRAGIVGMGPMGFRHLEAYGKLDHVHVVAVCDLRPEIKGKLDAGTSFYIDYNDMFEKEDLDVINVVTTGPYHAQIVIAAAKAGVPRILCEKPMATNVADAQEMVNVCKENNVRLAINHLTREFGPMKKFKQLLAQGVIGELRHLHFVMGGGRIGSIGTHFFDLMRFLTDSDADWVIGSIDESYQGDHKGRKIYDPGGYGIIHFSNGARATLDLGEDIGTPEQLLLSGSVGRALINYNDGTWKILARSQEDKEKRLGQYDLPLYEVPFTVEEEMDMVALTSRMISNLCSEEQLICSGEDGLAAIEIALAFHLSHQMGNGKVLIPYNNKEFTVDIT